MEIRAAFAPGLNHTGQLMKQYGNLLINVRQCDGQARQARLKTAEIIFTGRIECPGIILPFNFGFDESRLRFQDAFGPTRCSSCWANILFRCGLYAFFIVTIFFRALYMRPSILL
jgi:hypothetical protein